MDLLKEIPFQRLLSRYEKTFGAEPPVTGVCVDETIALMSWRLAACRRVGSAPAIQSLAGQHA